MVTCEIKLFQNYFKTILFHMSPRHKFLDLGCHSDLSLFCESTVCVKSVLIGLWNGFHWISDIVFDFNFFATAITGFDPL